MESYDQRWYQRVVTAESYNTKVLVGSMNLSHYLGVVLYYSLRITFLG
jgi:hypothetical protein